MAKKYIGGVGIETVEEMRERHPADFYPTEQALIDAYLKFTRFCLLENSTEFVADLGAGDGRWGQAVKNKFPWVKLLGTDIRDLPCPNNFNYWLTGNKGNIYSNDIKDVCGAYNLIIGNPPYSILEDWLEKCFHLVDKHDGSVRLLLSLNALSGLKRYNLFYNGEYPLSHLVVCSTRPSFSGDGKTYPGREYGMFEWIFENGLCLDSKEYADFYDRNPIEFLSYERRNKIQEK